MGSILKEAICSFQVDASRLPDITRSANRYALRLAGYRDQVTGFLLQNNFANGVYIATHDTILSDMAIQNVGRYQGSRSCAATFNGGYNNKLSMVETGLSDQSNQQGWALCGMSTTTKNIITGTTDSNLHGVINGAYANNEIHLDDASGSTIDQWIDGSGALYGAATDGAEGSGTINVSGGYYVNGSAIGGASGITAGTYGSSTSVPQCTFSPAGIATSCSNVSIPGGEAAITGIRYGNNTSADTAATSSQIHSAIGAGVYDASGSAAANLPLAGGALTGPLSIPDGAANRPSLYGAGQSTDGLMWSGTVGDWSLSANSTESFRMLNSTTSYDIVPSNYGLCWGSSGVATPDTCLWRNGGGIFYMGTASLQNAAGALHLSSLTAAGTVTSAALLPGTLYKA